MRSEPSIFDRLSVLADTTRSRLLLVLERQELTVSELCTVLQLPQSTVSRHLKILSDEGWVVGRADGTRRRYYMPEERLDPSARRLWRLVRDQATGLAVAEQDVQRLQAVLAQRRTKSQEFFSGAAGEWDAMRAELIGKRTDLLGLLAILDDDWVVGDLGCGTGQVAAAVAPFVRRVVAVDESGAMLGAARKRLADHGNVELRSGRLEALPVDDGDLDAAILLLVLHHLPDPAAACAELARVVRPGGRVVVVDLMPHEREEYRREMGHQWLGFSEEQLGEWLGHHGFERYRYRPLPADPAAQGPTMFAASARRAAAPSPPPEPMQ